MIRLIILNRPSIKKGLKYRPEGIGILNAEVVLVLVIVFIAGESIVRLLHHLARIVILVEIHPIVLDHVHLGM